mmetsp:Transcript_62238/g.181782  ORF Transcript_62238/g.181782 Transcript_62238/m.181782 type:complete len:199 (+) Transcript_62238:2319-2915(+)
MRGAAKKRVVPRLSGGPIQAEVPSVLPSGQKLWLLTLSRCPAAARQLLLFGDTLQACREALARVGCSVELASGALAFVRPQTYYYLELAAPVAAQLLGIKLLGKHIICSSEFEPLIRQVVGRLRGQDHVRIKRREQLSCDVQMPSVVKLKEGVLFQRNTFLEVAPHLSMLATTASTTDANLGGGKNPRRVAAVGSSEE